MLTWARQRYDMFRLPAAARRQARADRAGPPSADPGPQAAIAAAAAWLARAQDRTASGDDGVARHFSLIDGWATSYPETTGYIVPTMIVAADHLGVDAYRDRARRMLDWLVSIQLDDGGFQGGKIDAKPVVPVTFNTGQILLGLAAGVTTFGEAYGEAMHAAARFLRDSLDGDGCWRSHPTPFAGAGDKAYETHVAWGLFEAERTAPGNGYGEAGLRQVAWAIGRQQPNGWVADCCLTDPDRPLTHTLGYYLKGLVEAHRLSGDGDILAAARRTADGLLSAQRRDGALPGQLASDWTAAAPWSCLTGNVQIADAWFYLSNQTGEARYQAAGQAATAYVRRTMVLDGPEEVRGGVKGSFPVDGGYGTFEYLNWAAKFTIDACLAELKLSASG